jgi:hypothetical protein
MLRPRASRQVCLNTSIKHPSGIQDQFFITIRQLRVCWCGASSLARGRVCHLQILALANAVILGSETRGTHDHILLSHIRGSAKLEGQVPVLYPPGTEWPSYFPDTRFDWVSLTVLIIISRHGPHSKHHSSVPVSNFCRADMLVCEAITQ